MYGYERTTAMSAVGSGSVWLLVGGGMDYATIARDYIGTIIGIHSPIPAKNQTV